MSTFTPFEEKMESAGISTAAIKAFSRCYEALVSNPVSYTHLTLPTSDLV